LKLQNITLLYEECRDTIFLTLNYLLVGYHTCPLYVRG